MSQWLRENRVFIGFLIAFGLVRTAIADYNPIPSGSMRPNLLEGDVVLVNRLAFDLRIPLTRISVARLGEPERGDIVTFFSPQGNIRMIKRVVGLPGDVVAMRDKKLTINGEEAEYTMLDAGPGAVRLLENLGAGPHEIAWRDRRTLADDFGPVEIPVDHYLMLGDNRDHSADSRVMGLVPRGQLIGRAHHVLVSKTQGGWRPRFERFGRPLD